MNAIEQFEAAPGKWIWIEVPEGAEPRWTQHECWMTVWTTPFVSEQDIAFGEGEVRA